MYENASKLGGAGGWGEKAEKHETAKNRSTE